MTSAGRWMTISTRRGPWPWYSRSFGRVNRLLDRGGAGGLDARRNALRAMTEALGLVQAPPERILEDRRRAGLSRLALSEEEVRRLIEERNHARSVKDWRQADGIRDALKEKGVVLKDGPAGTTWVLAE